MQCFGEDEQDMNVQCRCWEIAKRSKNDIRYLDPCYVPDKCIHQFKIVPKTRCWAEATKSCTSPGEVYMNGRSSQLQAAKPHNFHRGLDRAAAEVMTEQSTSHTKQNTQNNIRA